MADIFKIYKKQIIGGILLVFFAAVLVIGLEALQSYKKPELQISFFDVGQGDSIFIEAKDGTQILVDGGPPNRVLPQLSKVMSYFDKHIDAIVLTHPHADHVSGLLEILDRYNVGEVIESGVDYNTAEAKMFEDAVKQKNIKRIIIDRPISFNFFHGAVLKFLYPDKSFAGQILKNVHDSALVSELDFEGKKILLMADAEKNVEKKLIDEKTVGDVDVLKVGHHGSKTSSNDFFLRAVKPEYAIISVGARNRYGHPHQDVLSRLLAAGAKVFRTDLSRTIILEINSGQMVFKTEK